MVPLQWQVSLVQYSGLWYQIARKPNYFEDDCVCSEAEYLLNGNEVLVLNSCTNEQGGNSTANGTATSYNSYNTRLDVYFSSNVPGQYWILEIDPNYQWVVVGEPCKHFGWILSRTKTMDQQTLDARIQTLVSRGYNVHDLIFRGNC